MTNDTELQKKIKEERTKKLNDMILILDRMIDDYVALQSDTIIGGSAHQGMIKLIEAKLWTINALSNYVDEKK